MARYSFDVDDGRATRDAAGTERARDAVPRGGGRQTIIVVPSDTDGQAVYTAILTFAGLITVR